MSYLKSRNLLLVLAGIFALALLVVITMRYRPESQLQQVVKALPQGVDVALEDIDYTHIEGGKPRWRLEAQQVERLSDSKVLAVKDPRLQFFDKNGKPEGTMQAGRGEVSEDYQQVRLYDNVVVKDTSGYTLYTDRLDYNHKTQVATTDKHVHLTSEGMDLEGVGMTFYVAKKSVLLKSRVKAKIVTE